MRGALASCCLALAFAAAPASAQNTDDFATVSNVFRDTLLGWCFKEMTGREMIAGVRPPEEYWTLIAAAETNPPGGALTPNARALSVTDGDVIVDRTSDACYVQGAGARGDGFDAPALAVAMRAAVTAAPFGAVELDDQTDSATRRSNTYGIVSEASDVVPVIVINEFLATNSVPGVVVGYVMLGSKDRRADGR